MKKVNFLVVLFVALFAVSCSLFSSPKRDAKKAIELLKEGDMEGLEAFEEEIEEKYKDDPEAQAEFQEALEQYTLEILKDAFNK